MGDVSENLHVHTVRRFVKNKESARYSLHSFEITPDQFAMAAKSG